MAIIPLHSPTLRNVPEADIQTISPEDLLKFASSLDSDKSGDSSHRLAQRQNALANEEFEAAIQELSEQRPDLFHVDSPSHLHEPGEFLTYPRRPQRSRQYAEAASDELAENAADMPPREFSLLQLLEGVSPALDSANSEDSNCPPSNRVNAMGEEEFGAAIQRLRATHPECFHTGRQNGKSARVDALGEEELEAAVQRLRGTRPHLFDAGRPPKNGCPKAATPKETNEENEKFCLAHILDLPPALDSSDSEDSDAPVSRRVNAEDLSAVVEELHKMKPDLFHSPRHVSKPTIVFPRRPTGTAPPRRVPRHLRWRNLRAVAPKARPSSPPPVSAVSAASGQGSTDFVSVDDFFASSMQCS